MLLSARKMLNDERHTKQWEGRCMPLSDDAYNKYFGKWPANNKDISKWILGHQPQIQHEEPKRSSGQFIYTPHDCELPDLAEIAVGSIWACYGYRNGRMCYDQWIIAVGENNNKSWQLFRRNI